MNPHEPNFLNAANRRQIPLLSFLLPTKENKGHRKVLASADINLKRFASPTPTQRDLALTLKPLSVKVVEATLKLSLSCVFVREGKAT